MHILATNDPFNSLQPGEKVFLESWFNLTHPQSLDSFRVRCHNGRTILEELKREMGFPFANAEDITIIATEAKDISSQDMVLQAILGSSWALLLNSLDQITSKNTKDESAREKEVAQIKTILLDTLPYLPTPYLAKTFSHLRQAIKDNKEKEIHRLAICLATDLAVRGWAVASLHNWVETQFLGEEWKSLPFEQRFELFEERLKRPPEKYEVVLTLSGSRQVLSLGKYGDFVFSADPPVIETQEIDINAARITKFLTKNKQRIFASTVVDAVDSNSAVHAAQEKFAKCQDRLRFNFCTEPLASWRAVLVSRQADKKHRIVHAMWRIPNPEHHLTLRQFLATNEKTDKLFVSKQISDESQRRLESAVRHYRLGLDANAYRDMLLNWWMGLETLTNAGDGKGIGPKVIKNAVPVLTHRYFTNQLRFLFSAVLNACGQWPDEAKEVLKKQPKPGPPWCRILAIQQDANASSKVTAALAPHPWLQMIWGRYFELANDPVKLATYLEAHEARVMWHILRIYRIRCCLVHGTPVVTPLQLPTANIEYYLREAIYVVLGAFLRARQINSLEQIFERTKNCSIRRKAILRDKGATPASIFAAMGSDIIYQITN
jgi:hypothetical protein